MTANRSFTRPLAAAVGLAAFVAVPAYAADVVYAEPPAPAAPMELPPVATWAGPYAGISLGYAFSGETTEEFTGESYDVDGWMGGAFGGFQMQNGAFVYGVEADINYSDMDGEAENFIGSGFDFETDTSVDGSLRARVGYTVTEDILLYGTGGLAAERREMTVTDPVAGISETDDNVALGYTVGAGIDARLTDQVFGRLEYRYTDYGNDAYDFGPLGGAEFDNDNHRVSVGLGIKF